MVWIGAWKCEISSSSFDQTKTVKAPAYLIDKYEVTNEQFKKFVDQGRYENRDYWRESQFLKDGQKISWEQAMSEFVDKTDQPGPATWEVGTYPEGKGDHPVSGVSWFEADAYARFIGKSLPTVHHWEHAASFRESIVIVPYSNFTTGETAPVGSHMGIGHTGLYDMAGNVKEWCWNATDDVESHRYILGGGWGEQTYLFTMRDSRSPWNRSAINGFRCVQYPEQDGVVPDELFGPLGQHSIRDYSTEAPCPDDEYQIIKRQFGYDRTPLNAVVESIDDRSPFWRKEKITFDAAYDDERVIAFLFVPRSVEPPYQVVVYWPGGGKSGIPTFTDLPDRDFTELIITGGRALLFPVYKGMFQRRLATWPDPRRTPLKFRDLIIQVSKDLQRSIDYLETRDDIDKERIAYYGMSGGAVMGPMVLAVESRFRAAVLVVGGFYTWMELPATTDPLNHAPRVNTPVLMINGKEDSYFPVETSQIPMFNLIATPEEDKKHKIYPGGHGLLGLFSKQIRGDVHDWLDRYLGPVKKKKDMK
jgi:dienelactone hydrolase